MVLGICGIIYWWEVIYTNRCAVLCCAEGIQHRLSILGYTVTHIVRWHCDTHSQVTL